MFKKVNEIKLFKLVLFLVLNKLYHYYSYTFYCLIILIAHYSSIIRKTQTF